eukprot:1261836-Pyramimonas_sp.AAC.2
MFPDPPNWKSKIKLGLRVGLGWFGGWSTGGAKLVAQRIYLHSSRPLGRRRRGSGNNELIGDPRRNRR